MMQTRNIDGALPGPINTQHCTVLRRAPFSYRSPNCVYNKAPATLMVFPGIRDQDWHLGVFIKKLLDPAVIDALPRVLFTGGTILGLIFGIAEVVGMRDVIGRLAAGVAARWGG